MAASAGHLEFATPGLEMQRFFSDLAARRHIDVGLRELHHLRSAA
jgi:hypothetical protein